MEKEIIIRYLAIILLCGIIGAFFALRVEFTGFSIFQQESAENFSLGTYKNTTHNGSAIVLAEEKLTGTYISEVFDVGYNSIWNNLSWEGEKPEINYLYVVDGSGAVYSSSDSGVTWTQKTDDYGRGSSTTDMFSDNIYLYIIFSGIQKEVYRSSNGVTWNIVNDTFTNKALLVGEVNSQGNLNIVTGSDSVWQSDNYGTTWMEKGDFNGGASNDAKGITINSNDDIFIVDGSGAVYSSSDLGVTWTQKTDDYGGGTSTDDIESDSLNNLYILLNTKVYKSTDNGATWSIINDSISPYANTLVEMLIDKNDNFFILDAVGRVFKSTDYGQSWEEIGDCNGGATNNPKGFTEFIQQTNLTFQVRNCSTYDCSDGVWQDADLTNLNLTGRYFQYKVEFTSPDSSITPILSRVIIDYTVLNTPPTISLVYPQNGDSYGYNESLQLNFSVFDNEDNIESCWYNIDGGLNVTISNCQNTIFNVSEGQHTLNVYVNDTNGEESSDSVIFNVQVGAPTIVLHFPADMYLNYQKVEFNYTPEDIDLDSCELWGNFDGEFRLNKTKTNPSNGIINTFSLNLDDGEYLWNVRCNDSMGNAAFNGNKTFYIDTISPSVSLNEPSGIKKSRTVTASWTVSDSNLDSCWYNVYRGVNLEMANTSINCSLNSVNFDVTVDANFVFNFYANDSAGNLNFSYLEFSVDTTSSPTLPESSSGGGGGGGGSIRPIISSGKLEVGKISNLIVNPGETKKMVLNVKNIGNKFLNSCRIIGRGKNADWITSADVKGLSAGEEQNFIFTLNVPLNLSVGSYDIEISLECQESNKSINFTAEIIEKKLALELINAERVNKNTLRIIYSLAELSDIEQEVEVGIILFGHDNEKLAELTETRKIVASSTHQFETELDIPPSLEGSFNLLINAISETSSTFVQEEILLGKSKIGGFAILDKDKQDTFFSIVLAIIFGIFAVFIIRRILKLKKIKETKK